ncbi:hypothetical protein SDC9_168694 [bioreactor metagenome]|uniref:Uncharacterized protein n=1 Tax=bioreactor metagenome TaxID=1076179 RepID=A0A645G3U3_9ZZZZ
MGEYPRDPNIRRLGPDIVQQIAELRFLDYAGTVLAYFDFNNRLGFVTAVSERILNEGCLFDRIQPESQMHARLHQFDDASELDIPHNFIGDKDVSKPMCRHHLGLPHFCHGDSPGSPQLLHAGDPRDFVGLGVRPERYLPAVRIRLHPIQIAHH